MFQLGPRVVGADLAQVNRPGDPVTTRRQDTQPRLAANIFRAATLVDHTQGQAAEIETAQRLGSSASQARVGCHRSGCTSSTRALTSRSRL